MGDWVDFLLFMQSIWPSQRVPEERVSRITAKRKMESPVGFPCPLPLSGASFPRIWELESQVLGRIKCSFWSKKVWESWGWKRSFTRLIARSIATTGYLPIPKTGLPPSLPYSHHHHITITIITYPIAHPGMGRCARWFTYIVSFSSHTRTKLHLGTWGLEKPHDLSKDTTGQMVELEMEQVCLNTKPLPSTSRPYSVSLVLEWSVMNTWANG